MPFLLSSLVLAGLVFCLARLLYRRFLVLSEFDGPWLAKHSRAWLAYAYFSERPHERFLEVNKKYGKFARIGPNHLLTDDLEAHWRILGSKSKYVRSEWFDSLRLDPWFASIASERDPVKHDLLRAKVAAGYMTRDFPDLEPLVDREVANWVERVMKKEGQVLDIGRSVRTCTLEIAARICYSKGLDLADDDVAADAFWASIEEAAPYGQYLSLFNGLFRLLHHIAYFPALKSRLLLVEGNNPGIGHLLKYSRLIVEDRFQKEKPQVNDMMGSWMKHGLTQHEIETEASIAIVTGAFPTASAINVLALHISTNPRIKSILCNEIDNALRSGKVSTPLRYADVTQLPYLQACVDEALRLVPPIVQLRERVVPSSGDVIDGVHLPPGTLIGLNTQAVAQHPCFGTEPDIYRPERWLETSEAELKQMRKVMGLVFGYGGTKCLGVTQAMIVVYKFVFELFRQCNIEVTRPGAPWKAQCNGVFFHKDFFVTIQRKDSESLDKH
ncbi:cytochrome P450 [Amniculicola lignicola CBS 123094]|uniref:Cytochrome P450 n=1 Tax=Amniculicola lignicola CBS 123094 TaxID=1392246 RepID=A0A6A5W722_9PLEO|nr:cytochrome P450 [Amniculicola lignicola CBS 123094]